MLRMYCQRFGMTGGLAGLILVLIFAGTPFKPDHRWPIR